jgi:hypothetical protein
VNSVNSLLAYDHPDASASRTSLCVSVQRSQASIQRGGTARWIVSVWAQGGNVSGATVRLSASPSGQSPAFSFGCGSHDGTATCGIGGVDSSSSTRQFQARVPVAASASSITSVRLTATASATNLSSDPKASVAVQVTASGGLASTAASGLLGPTTSTSPLSVGSMPSISGPGGTKLSLGGNASNLFPALNPSSSTEGPGSATTKKASTRPLADTSALPLGTPVVGAQLAGLGALAVGFILAVTRLSVRRRSAAKPPAE